MTIFHIPRQPGRRIAHIVLYMCNDSISKYVGTSPPLKNMVNAKYTVIAVFPIIFGRDRAYAVIMVSTMLMIVPNMV